ncbi:hypothetical protein NC651_039603 [Populus alba x Populus x berolinensis]|nr:hypothetical protein NC651_039603 [Populus alba x Populus x berolinensis]
MVKDSKKKNRHVSLSPLSVLVLSFATSEDSSTKNHDKLSKKRSHLIPVQQDSSLPASPSPAHLLQSLAILFLFYCLFWIFYFGFVHLLAGSPQDFKFISRVQ